MDEITIESAGKGKLRAMCKKHGIAYGRLTNDGMRAAIRKHTKPDGRAHVAERLSDTPVIKIVRKVSAPSVLELLKLIPVRDTFSCKEIARRTGATEQSARTIIQSCNSSAPSNVQFHKTGLRFELKRGQDNARRTR
jgi:predicted transcriptional regulator